MEELYIENYYKNFTIEESKRYAIPNLNVIVSPIRITQRRMKLVPSEDIYTQSFNFTRWASLGFDYDASFDPEVESDESYNGYTYT